MKKNTRGSSYGNPKAGAHTPGAKKNVQWQLEDGVLTLMGQGAVPNYGAGEQTPWENRKQEIHTVIAEPGVTVIGDRAFMGCDRLRKLVLGADMRRVGFRAFAECPLLEQVDCPGELVHFRSGQPGVTMGMGAFAGTPWLERRFGEYYIHDGIVWEYFGAGGAVKIPDGVRVVGNMAFEGSRITAAELPGSLREIRPFAFAHTLLREVELPESLEQVDAHAFRECGQLRQVYIANQALEMHPTALSGTPLAQKVTKKWPSIYTLAPRAVRGMDSCKALVYREKTGIRIGVPHLDVGRAILRKLQAGSLVARIRLDEEKKRVYFVQVYAYDGFWGCYSVELMFPCRDENGELSPWRDSNTFLDTSDILYLNTEGLDTPGRYQWFWCSRQTACQSTLPVELLEEWLRLNPEYTVDSEEENIRNDPLRMFVPA